MSLTAYSFTKQPTGKTAHRQNAMCFRSVVEASADCTKILDLKGRIEFINAAGVKALQLASADDAYGNFWADYWPDSSRQIVENAIANARLGRDSTFSAPSPTPHAEARWWDIAVTPLRDNGGSVVQLLAISKDITAQKSDAESLLWADEHDKLTGLPNRKSFERHLRAATIRAISRGGRIGLLLLDLDHFKHINDTYGYAAGDHLLQVFGSRLCQSVRSNDFVARLAGDEFAIIVESDPEIDLIKTGQSILARLQQPISHDGALINLTASIGGALFPKDAITPAHLFKYAGIALHDRKNRGRGGTLMFEERQRQENCRISEQMAIARTALNCETVEPHYQQKVSLQDGRIVGFEALLRWRHPGQGIQSPDTISEAFRDYELASKIGDLMQRKVFADISRWKQQGLQTGRIGINAAPAEFLRDDYCERLMERMDQFKISPESIEIEITEQMLLENSSTYIRRALNSIAAFGVTIALDDFGTGYSSLSHLKDYPVKVVKIDRSFVSNITENPDMRAIVRAIIDLSKLLGIEVVAEGVECGKQRDCLTDDGCHLAQGYLFGTAITAEEMPLLLDDGVLKRHQ